MKKITILIITLMATVSVFAQEQKEETWFRRGVKNSFLNKKAPALVVEKWMTVEPDTVGKFILFEIYGLMCPPCWEAVPRLNAFHEKYKDKMVIIGCNRSKGKHPKEPDATYYKGYDTQSRTYHAIDLRFVPYALLVDPKGIVRWEGSPNDLTDKIIKKILKKYRKR
ncbi:TlpA family protein disulfide reductase [Butyricimonas hominis]|uniref:TlpA family protein disulfide reductase n=1 Tax=Butyricimonas TaxID=574697 RepID=UPI003515AB66